jgi:uncharacterized membrane protein (UPF0127 family)
MTNRPITRALIALVLASGAGAALAQMPKTELTAGSAGEHRITAEVAANDADLRLGLMYRTSLPADHGMIFVYPINMRVCMWMKNTLIPLSVAFLDSEGRILNIEDMTPQTEDSHCSAKLARYALEMNRKWFKEHKLKPGDTIQGIKTLNPR